MKAFVVLIFLSCSCLIYSQNAVYVAHRGASYLAPENTLASIKLAWELGAAAAECDILLTKDKQVIVFHDKKGKRLTGEKFNVKEVNYEDIKDLPIILRQTNSKKYEGENIPLLKDVLATVPEDRTLVIEIKTGPEILPYMQEVIDKHWQSGNIAFIAFDYQTIIETKKRYPEIPCYYLSAFKADVERKLDVIARSDLDGVNLRHKIINTQLVNSLRAMNKDIWCWTVNDPEDALRMENLGVSAITTDRPVWLKEKLGEMK